MGVALPWWGAAIARDRGSRSCSTHGCVSALKVVGAVFFLGWDLGLESASQIEISRGPIVRSPQLLPVCL